VGVVVGIASLAPIRIIQGVLLLLWGTPEMESGHPLVKMLTDGTPSVFVMLVASFAAVVVAPVCEEISFRLLLQGWLEKWESVRLGIWAEGRLATESDTQNEPSPTIEMTNSEFRMTNVESAVDEEKSSIVNPQSSIDALPDRGYAGMPFGWFPIIVTSVFFGLAHFGYGPEPLPLFVLALMLGYVYQRTHRIVPCIVAHAIFNAFTMFALWRIVFHAT
jgi:membrane protease YdiL (CAAX protease family)